MIIAYPSFRNKPIVTFEDAFTRFIVCSLKEMNEWKNIDILFNSQRNKESDSLFVIIYENCR